MTLIRFETALWDALEPEDKISQTQVNYRPAVEYDRTGVNDDDIDDFGTATGFMVMAHPNIDDTDELILALAKVRRADAYLANISGG